MNEKPLQEIDNENLLLGNEEIIEDEDELQATSPYRYSITSYGADYPVDGLVKRLDADDIVIPTFDPEEKTVDEVEGFQRQFIWSKPQCDRFIESLLLGLPVPGIFLVKLPDGRLLVLDGQQRLRTLKAFYKGILRGKEFTLQNVQEGYKGSNYSTLDAEDRRRMDDSIIHSTIVRQDEPSDDQSSIYLIFERLNTGGTTLHPQEIRVALYRGGFTRLLREINDFAPWRELYGKKSNRLKDQELILRFFGLLFWADQYSRPIKDFLNRYIGENREFQIQSEEQLREIFQNTILTIQKGLGNNAFRLKAAVNAAVLDSLMVGVGHRLVEGGSINDLTRFKEMYQDLIKNEKYLAAVEKSTSDDENVKTRLKLAKESFIGIR